HQLVLGHRLPVVVVSEIGDVIDRRAGVSQVAVELFLIPLTPRNPAAARGQQSGGYQDTGTDPSAFHACTERNPTGKRASASASLMMTRVPACPVATSVPSKTFRTVRRWPYSFGISIAVSLQTVSPHGGSSLSPRSRRYRRGATVSASLP